MKYCAGSGEESSYLIKLSVWQNLSDFTGASINFKLTLTTACFLCLGSWLGSGHLGVFLDGLLGVSLYSACCFNVHMHAGLGQSLLSMLLVDRGIIVVLVSVMFTVC